MTSHARLERAFVRIEFRKRLLRYVKGGEPHKVPLVVCRTLWQAANYAANLAVLNGELW